jgi:hypothetical protein
MLWMVLYFHGQWSFARLVFRQECFYSYQISCIGDIQDAYLKSLYFMMNVCHSLFSDHIITSFAAWLQGLYLALHTSTPNIDILPVNTIDIGYRCRRRQTLNRLLSSGFRV